MQLRLTLAHFPPFSCAPTLKSQIADCRALHLSFGLILSHLDQGSVSLEQSEKRERGFSNTKFIFGEKSMPAIQEEATR